MGSPNEYYSIEDWLTNSQHSDPVLNAMVIYTKLHYIERQKASLLLTGKEDPDTPELIQAIMMDPTHAFNICIRHLVAGNIFRSYSKQDDFLNNASEMWMKTFMTTAYEQTLDFHKAAIADRKEKLQRRLDGIRKKAAKAWEVIAKKELSEIA
jgi:hypothetical protein